MIASILACLVTLNAAVFALLVFGAARDARARRKEVRGQRSEPAPEDLREATLATRHSPHATPNAQPCAICGKTHPHQVTLYPETTADPIVSVCCPRCHHRRPAPPNDGRTAVGVCFGCGLIIATPPASATRAATDGEVDAWREAAGPELWSLVAEAQDRYHRRQLAPQVYGGRQ